MPDALPDAAPLRILIADDSHSDRLILKKLVSRLGHQVIAVADGLEAVAAFKDQHPDIVLLDALMPQMDGLEAARQIKALAGDELVPVIFLTSLSDAASLAGCLDAGGDDFLAKPYNRVILEAKIKAFNRMRLMHRTLSDQRDLIRERNERLLDEQTIAKRVFDNVAHTGCLDAANIRFVASPMSIFNGDVLFACPRPAGGMNILIGDFTGHGLPAAIGAMPVAEVFYAMTSKGFSGSDVLQEINQKLRRILPTGMFCCAGLVQADFQLGQLAVWNGGLPDGFLIRKQGDTIRLPSTHLPLGVLDADAFDATMELYMTSPGDTVLLMTDGAMEAEDGSGNMLGESAIGEAIAEAGAGNEAVAHILSRIRSFTGQQRESDDMTLVSMEMIAQDHPQAHTGTLGRSALEQSVLEGPAEWACSYEISDGTLARFSPLPLLLHICMEVPALRRRSGEIYTLLAELYNNALEHGILGLPSEWKQSPQGFARYYIERQRRMSAVEGHFIRFDFRHRQTSTGGQLTVICEDSGDGFDFSTECPNEQDTGRYSGRGLLLIQELADSINICKPGNRVEIVYNWQAS